MNREGTQGTLFRKPYLWLHDPPADPRYSLTFYVEAVNALNNTNPGAPVGILTSPYFGKSISTNSVFGLTSAANRIVFVATVARDWRAAICHRSADRRGARDV